MSRFAAYLASQKLAKMHLATAEERYNKGDSNGRVLGPLIHSIREFQTAMNNVASMQFERRKKKAVRR